MSVAPTLSVNSTLADLALSRPLASRVLWRHGLDFCCNGRRTLQEACDAEGLDALGLLHEVRLLEARPSGAATDWSAAPLGDLIEHLLKHYHEDHRAEVPRLISMAAKVEQVHAARPECPTGLREHLERMLEELELHMQKEEQILFPLVDSGRGPMAGMPIQVMEQEHQDHGANLERMRELAHGYAPPEDACNTWRALYLGLSELEHALMAHIHLENHVLFPRALRGEA